MPKRVEFSMMTQANIRRENSIKPTMVIKSRGSTRANSTMPCAFLRLGGLCALFNGSIFIMLSLYLTLALPAMLRNYCEILVNMFSAIAAKIPARSLVFGAKL